MYKYKFAMMLAGVAMLAGACGSTSGDGADEPAATTPVPTTTQTSLSAPEPISTQAEGADFEGGVATGLAPDSVIQDVFATAEELTGSSRVEMTLLRAQAVMWSDGSLGCPEAGVNYTQATVDGQLIQLVFDGTVWDFRVSEAGQITLCDNSETAPDLGPDR